MKDGLGLLRYLTLAFFVSHISFASLNADIKSGTPLRLIIGSMLALPRPTKHLLFTATMMTYCSILF